MVSSEVGIESVHVVEHLSALPGRVRRNAVHQLLGPARTEEQVVVTVRVLAEVLGPARTEEQVVVTVRALAEAEQHLSSSYSVPLTTNLRMFWSTVESYSHAFSSGKS